MGPSYAEVFICLIAVTGIITVLWILCKPIVKKPTNCEFTLVCTPEGYRRVLAQCEIAKITPKEYFNRAINLMSDDLKLPRPDDTVVI